MLLLEFISLLEVETEMDTQMIFTKSFQVCMLDYMLCWTWVLSEYFFFNISG